jgi:hypothetical protein
VWTFLAVLAISLVVYAARTVRAGRRGRDVVADMAAGEPLPATATFEANLSQGHGLAGRWRGGFADLADGRLSWRPRFGLSRSTDLSAAVVTGRRPARGWEVILINHTCEVLECHLDGQPVRLALLPDAAPIVAAALGRASR